MSNELFYSSIYGELTKNVQIRFDAVSELHKKLFDNILFERFLSWDTPTIGLNFEEIIGKYGMTVAAATIGDNSKEPIMGTDGAQYIQERVLNHAITKPLTIQEYRKILQLLDSKSLSDKAKTEQLVKTMWDDVQDVVRAVLNKIDLIFLTALSNEGKFEFDENNNPEGGVRGLIDYNQPAENILVCSGNDAWTPANRSTVDCFEAIQRVLDAAMDKTTFTKVLCSPALISYMCRSTLMKKMIFGSDKSSQIVQLKHINEYMQENEFPTFEPIRRQILIQNGTRKIAVNPWNVQNMVFIPSEKLGTVKNAFANNELKQEPGVTYSNYGRVRVSQWGKGETDNSNGVEFTKAECFALPVITEMNGIYTLETNFSAE